MADFAQAVAFVLENEGSELNAGEGTKYGIYEHKYNEWGGGDNDFDNMSEDDAKSYYYDEWWIKMGLPETPHTFDEIEDDKVATKLFDFMINAGPSHAGHVVQRALGIEEDGIVGGGTIEAINDSNPEELYEALKQGIIDYYESIGGCNLDGWLNRANRDPDGESSGDDGDYGEEGEEVEEEEEEE